MSTSVLFNGTTYAIPAVGERRWGQAVTNFLIAVGNNALSKSGGNFDLSADVNFGASYGIISKYVKSGSANIAQSGVIRLANTDKIAFRNAANSADVSLGVSASDRLQVGSTNVVLATDKISTLAAVTSSELASVISDETGTGLIVFNTSPSIATPTFTAETSFTEIATPATPSAGILKVYPKSDDKLYTLNSSGVETQVGSGASSGTVNYISNSDFEATANGVQPAGWSQYNDSAVAIPVDGTGGSAVSQVTFLASNSSPIRGTVSAVLTKDANNRQGVGYSFPITIAAVDKSKKMNLSAELTVGSGTYANGDLAFYLYDVTNSVVITPSVAAIPGITNKWSINFDTTTSTSYRLCIHIASTSASAYTMKFDTLSVDSGVVIQGASIGPWTSFSPVINNVGSKVFSTSGRWRRVGDSMEVEFNLSGNATASGSSAPTQVSMTIPGGYTIDSTGLPVAIGSDGNIVGNGFDWGVTAAATYTALSSVCPISTTTVGFIFGSNTVFALTSSLNIARAMQFAGRMLVPIAEWAGSGTVNIGAGAQIMYAYNSSTSTTDDTTSFANGPQGVLFTNMAPTGTAFITKRIRFPSPVVGTPQLKVIDPTAPGVLQDFDTLLGSYGINSAGTLAWGARVAAVAGSTTDFNVYFSATYDQVTTHTWATINTFKWVVVAANPSSPVGFGLASATASGLLNYYDEGTFTANFNLGMQTSSNNYTVGYVRAGKIVTLSFPDMRVTANVTANFWSAAAGALPTTLRPPVLSKGCPATLIYNNVSEVGNIILSPNGSLIVYRQSEVNFTSGTTNAGLYYATITYSVA